MQRQTVVLENSIMVPASPAKVLSRQNGCRMGRDSLPPTLYIVSRDGRSDDHRNHSLSHVTGQRSQGRESRGQDQKSTGVIRPGGKGQFEVIANGEKVAQRDGNWLTRSFGAGYPDVDDIIERLVQKQQGESSQR